MIIAHIKEIETDKGTYCSVLTRDRHIRVYVKETDTTICIFPQIDMAAVKMAVSMVSKLSKTN